MKYKLQEGTFKGSKYVFIGTGIFLVALFGYQLFEHVQTDDFNSDFPGDWDKVLGVALGIYFTFRSRVFALRSRDLFIEVTDSEVRYRVSRKEPIKKIERSKIDRLEVKKGVVTVLTKESTKKTILDLNEFRLRDEQRASIINGLKKSLNV